MFNNNPYNNENKSKRQPVYANNGVVATSQPLASQAGLEILQKGGNAIDAAIATAACLTVVEPTSNGIGGDAFAIVWFNEQMYGLNASGKSPKNISIDALNRKGYKAMPKFGTYPITVPGAPSAWVALSERFGRLSLKDCLAPAIQYAEQGYPLSPELAKSWDAATKAYQKVFNDPMFEPWFDTFTINKQAPKAGDTWKSLGHANTLKAIAETHGKAFYHGDIAEKIANYIQTHGGFLSLEDLKAHKPLWVEPISANYKGYDIWELPPNGQGLITLQSLTMLAQLNQKSIKPEHRLHYAIESLKLAFTDALEHITDNTYMNYSPDDFLTDLYAKERLSKITDKATLPTAAKPHKGGTVYLATADRDGNMVSFIQSNYMGFGSGIVIPNTGIALQNRGHNFSMDKSHVNALAPNKRSYHTIIPGFVTKDNKGIGPFGVMGGFMQPQGHLQVILNSIDDQMNPQAALDRPRWQWIEKNTLHVESDFPKDLIESLRNRGHNVIVKEQYSSFGRGQIIWRNNAQKTYVAGTEKRTDGTISIY